MADKTKSLNKDESVSLIAVIENEERLLRQEVKQAGDEAEARILKAQEQMQRKIAQSQQELPGLIAQVRTHKLKQAHDQAKQLYLSSEKQRGYLLKQIQMNMPRAVQSLVEVITATGDKT
jgi:vacuolar-type H+-ATPase subunit H